MRNKSEVMKDLGRVKRRKISMQKLEITKDSIGQQKKNWTDWIDLWVERDTLWGSEYYAAKAVNEENTVVFIAKYVAFLEALNPVEYRVTCNGKLFDIKQVDFLKDNGMWIKIKALERGADNHVNIS